MKKLWIVLPMVGLLAACETQQQNTLAGAAAGAAIGSAVADDDLTGAVIGGVAGAAAGSMIGRNTAGQCVYRRADGSTFTAAC